jgi:hypothetical protein
MKISNDTLTILKNCASINQSLFFREGSKITTITEGKSVYLNADVAEKFPRDFAIYELSDLIQILSLDPEQEVDFKDTYLTVSSNGGKFKYFYSSVDLVPAPSKTPPAEGFYSFNLSSKDISTILSASKIVAGTTISIVSKDGKVKLVVSDPKNPSGNSYSKNLPECDRDFDIQLSLDNFKVISADYDVHINEKKFIYMKHTSKELGYWFAVSPDSTIG